VVNGVDVREVEQDPAGVTVKAADGRTWRAELLVGADGVNSAVRWAVFGAVAKPVYAGYTAWRGVAAAPAGATAVSGEIWGDGARFGSAAMTEGRAYWYATATMAAGGRSQPAEEKAELRRRFAGWPADSLALIEATDESVILRHDIVQLRPDLATFVRGRVALLGDAAHAMTPDLGQGACLALEDAVVLAAAVGAAGLPAADGAAGMPAALRRYDAERRPRVQPMARQSWRMGALSQRRTRPARWARAAMLRLVRFLPAPVLERGLHAAADWQPPRR
jgi:2-polyprenyl-6-methoxyphenol hydroxylase-like FAD-dependent oxidoreductase